MTRRGKRCSKCSKLKPFIDFAYRGCATSRRRSDYCIDCELIDKDRTKVCLRCGETKSLLMFRRHKNSPGGYTKVCMACQVKQQEINREEAEKNPATFKGSKNAAKALERAILARQWAEQDKLAEERAEEYELSRPVICRRCGRTKEHRFFKNLYPQRRNSPLFSVFCTECQELAKSKPKGMSIETWERVKREQERDKREKRMEAIIRTAREMGISYGRVVALEKRGVLKIG